MSDDGPRESGVFPVYRSRKRLLYGWALAWLAIAAIVQSCRANSPFLRHSYGCRDSAQSVRGGSHRMRAVASESSYRVLDCQEARLAYALRD